MARSKHTLYTPVYPQKYVGKYPIALKSNWELEFVKRDCDINPSCVQWAYEPVQIPYFDPVRGRQKIYIPDILMTFVTPQGGQKTVLVEIKPMHEFYENYARKGDGMVVLRNRAKYQAGAAWAIRRGIRFTFITEAQMFKGANKKKPLRKTK